MLKASALYMVIIIALVIGLLCSSLIVAAYFYKTEYQKKFRYDRLANNAGSGVNILLVSEDTAFYEGRNIDLFGNTTDSVSLRKLPWGVYDIGISKAFIQKDTLLKVFSLANVIDSAKWAALYLVDENRPFSLSGKTTIRGDAYIPASGVKEAYINNIAYEGDKRLIQGIRHLSEKELPPLDKKRLGQLEHDCTGDDAGGQEIGKNDSVRRSFLLPTRFVNFKKEVKTLSDTKIDGNIVLVSDTSLIIDSTAILNNVLVFAKTIVIKAGFHGRAQFFATDSIKADSNCRFMYPSCLGILRFKDIKTSVPANISLGNNSELNGTVFTYEQTASPVKPLIVIGKNAQVRGQVYAQGVLQLNDKSKIDGSVFTSRFLYKSQFTLYENYLINTTIDSKALSPYYLSSDLFPVVKKQKEVLQWLEKN